MNDLLPDSEWIKASRSMKKILDSNNPNRRAIQISPYIYHDALTVLKSYLKKDPLESIDACRALTAFPKEISLPILKSALTDISDYERSFFESAIEDLEANLSSRHQ